MSSDVMHIPVTRRIADEFLSSVRETFELVDDEEMDDLYLSSSARAGVPISYDQALEPFIGQTRGYNPPADRVYLSEESFILRAIEEALIDANRHGIGARVFLTKGGAYYVDGDKETVLVRWDWPAENLEEQVEALERLL